LRPKALLVVPIALLAAACGSSSSPTTTSTPAAATSTPTNSHASPGLSTRKVSGLGTILTNQTGRTLYTFSPEKGGKIACTGSCATAWPALATSGQPSVSSALVHPSLVGSVADPSGGKVITYAGWPMRTYTGDTQAGQATGQGSNAFGGKWYVISPSGQLITTSASSSSSGGGGAYGY
jgi:predicted lipoprotein with Yx(FWY)xxD motif